MYFLVSIGEEALDDSVKYQTLPAAHFNETVYPTSTSATVGHQVDKAGTADLIDSNCNK